jgi:hypothetical protein
MDVWNLLSVGASTLVMVALIHVACYYAVKTMYPPTPVRVQVAALPPPVPTVRFDIPPSVAAPVPPEIPLVTTKLPPPVDTRDPGPARSSQPAFSEAAKENEVKVPSNVPTYESLLSAVSSSKEGGGTLGPMSGASI